MSRNWWKKAEEEKDINEIVLNGNDAIDEKHFVLSSDGYTHELHCDHMIILKLWGKLSMRKKIEIVISQQLS